MQPWGRRTQQRRAGTYSSGEEWASRRMLRLVNLSFSRHAQRAGASCWVWRLQRCLKVRSRPSQSSGVAGRKTSKSVLTEEASELEESHSEFWTRARRRSRAAFCRGAMLRGPAGGSVMNPTSGEAESVQGASFPLRTLLPLRSVYQIPTAALTSHHRPSGLKQHTCITL